LIPGGLGRLLGGAAAGSVLSGGLGKQPPSAIMGRYRPERRHRSGRSRASARPRHDRTSRRASIVTNCSPA
jgi:hypothetical protein